MKMRSLVARLVPIAFALSAGAAHAQAPVTPVAVDVPDVAAAPATVVDTASDRSRRMTVPVTIAGRGPFAFIVDTGADRTVVSRELAAQLGLAAGKPATLHSMTGAGRVDTVVLGGLDVEGRGGERLRTNEPIHAPALAEIDLGARGLLGVDSLQGRRVVMDFARNTLTIADAKARERLDRDTIVVTARSRYGQLILVDADIAGTPITVIIDSGAQNTIGNHALRTMLARRGKGAAFRADELIDVTGGRLPVEVAAIGRVRIGGLTIDNVTVAFADAHPFKRFGLLGRPAMLLGVDTLRSFRRVSIDFAARKIRFLLPDQAANPSGREWFTFRSPVTTSLR